MRKFDVGGSSTRIPKVKKTVSKPRITASSDLEEERRKKKENKEKGKRKLGDDGLLFEEEEAGMWS